MDGAGGLIGESSQEEALYRIAGGELSDPLFPHFSGVVRPDRRIEEYPPRITFPVHVPSRPPGSRHDSGRSSPSCYPCRGEGYLSFP